MMKQFSDILLIVGFAAVDGLFFHDLFKPGEVTSVPQILTGMLSLIVIYKSFKSLMPDRTKK